MDDENGTESTHDDERQTGTDPRHGGDEGHKSDIPEESPSTESGVALSHKVAERESGEQDQ